MPDDQVRVVASRGGLPGVRLWIGSPMVSGWLLLVHSLIELLMKDDFELTGFWVVTWLGIAVHLTHLFISLGLG